MFGLEASPLMATRVHEVLQHALADMCPRRCILRTAARPPAAPAAAGPRSRDSLERARPPAVSDLLWPPARRFEFCQTGILWVTRRGAG